MQNLQPIFRGSVISKYDEFFCYNVHQIRPEKDEFFVKNGSQEARNNTLSHFGYKMYWQALNDAIRRIDTGRLDTVKEMVRIRDAEVEAERRRMTHRFNSNNERRR